MEDFGEKPPPIVGMVSGSSIVFLINSPDLLQDVYVTKNFYFDKHPAMQKITNKLWGNSTVVERSTELWVKKRKSLSSAFYKEKLIKMIEVMKEVIV